MNQADSTTVPAHRLQWKLSSWFVLVAILGWAFVISPSQIVITDAIQLANDKQSVSTTKYLNPHYFAPALALAAFACWKEVANQPGFLKPASGRRIRRIAMGLTLLATACAVGALCARVHFGWEANIPGPSGPQFWARGLVAVWSLAFYCSAGTAIGLAFGLILSSQKAKPR